MWAMWASAVRRGSVGRKDMVSCFDPLMGGGLASFSVRGREGAIGVAVVRLLCARLISSASVSDSRGNPPGRP